MAEPVNDTQSGEPLRSLRDERFALVTFESKTIRRINVFWLDYSGQRVKYATLEAGDAFPIMTYETHPWIFRDVDNEAMVLANGKEVYYPKAYDGREDPPVQIHIPVYSLRTLCIMVVRQHHSPESVKSLDIPRDLMPDILYKENVPYMERIQF